MQRSPPPKRVAELQVFRVERRVVELRLPVALQSLLTLLNRSLDAHCEFLYLFVEPHSLALCTEHAKAQRCVLVLVKTVYHVSDVAAYRTAEAKVRNLLDDETLDVEAVAVVVDRPTVIDAVALDLGEATAKLVELGATIKLCSNAAKGADAVESDFGEGVEFVSSGVGELTRLQNEGWSYIRL